MSDKTLLSSWSAAPIGQRGSSALVIENDSQTLEKLRNILESAGYDVHGECSPEAVCRRNDLASFAVVLLDRQLDEGVFSHIRESAPHVPLILMSDRSDVREAVSALWQGASDYLIKPITPAILRMSLEQVRSQPRLEEAYQIERAFAENLLDLAPSIVLVLDTNGRIVRFNRFLEELSGYRLEEVEGRDWFETFLPEEDRPRLREAARQVLEGGTFPENANPILTRSRRRRHISWRCRPFTDVDGKAIGILWTGQDVTELLEAQNLRVRTERLAKIGQTIAAVSHEARNELYALRMGLDLLRQTLEGDGEILEILGELEESQMRLTRLFEDVRAFAGPMKLERRRHNLRDIWQKAWNSVKTAKADRDAVLHENLFAPKILCDIDGFRVEEVFRNLFENSLAACSDPAEIEITCTPAVLDQRDAVEIRVRDNGPGLTENQREKLFEAFFTTKSTGTGLGLALVKRIIEAHQGTIAVSPESRSGTEFVITLPVEEPRFSSPAPE